MIPPLIPPQAPLEELIHGPLPTPEPPIRVPDADAVYGMSTVGDGGRVSDRHVLGSLGWIPGTRLEAIAVDGVVVVRPIPGGAVRITSDGYLRIPYRVRRQLCLFVGDRVLLIGHRRHRQLVLHPPAALDERLRASLALMER
ncbi:hypothetical protein [Nocardia nepalensis]|uniref:hypothetical protein n=1 Tax=Nocardia nepalensis TaxID=3375448 RepID=UPI003B66E435